MATRQPKLPPGVCPRLSPTDCRLAPEGASAVSNAAAAAAAINCSGRQTVDRGERGEREHTEKTGRHLFGGTKSAGKCAWPVLPLTKQIENEQQVQDS